MESRDRMDGGEEFIMINLWIHRIGLGYRLDSRPPPSSGIWPPVVIPRTTTTGSALGTQAPTRLREIFPCWRLDACKRMEHTASSSLKKARPSGWSNIVQEPIARGKKFILFHWILYHFVHVFFLFCWLVPQRIYVYGAILDHVLMRILVKLSWMCVSWLLWWVKQAEQHFGVCSVFFSQCAAAAYLHDEKAINWSILPSDNSSTAIWAPQTLRTGMVKSIFRRIRRLWEI